MNNSKHTPGPWDCSQVHVDNGNFWIGTAKDYIGELYPANSDLCISEEEAEANARLIAAAPVLLEALKGMIEAGHLGVKLNVRKPEHFSWMNAEACARKAVLQAEGG